MNKKKTQILSALLLLSFLPGCSCTNKGEEETAVCTDPRAENYDPAATLSDGSCIYAPVELSPLASYPLAEVLKESSGLLYWEGSLWTHNDSEDKSLYRLDTTDGSVLEIIPLAGVENNDWEDIAQDEDYLYLGDFGNNLGNRRDLHILKIEKSSLRSGTIKIDTIRFSFTGQEDFSPRPQAHNYDCEAMTIVGDQIILFTKEWLSAGTTLHMLSKEAGQQQTTKGSYFPVEGLISGATYDKVTNTIIMCGYTPVLQPFLFLLYNIPEEGFGEADDFRGNKRRISIDLAYHQVEGLAVTTTGILYLSNEAFSSQPLLDIPQQLHVLDIAEILPK